jgi:adenosylmethionine-8-amino-7-oxononanoate aminotransferase
MQRTVTAGLRMGRKIRQKIFDKGMIVDSSDDRIITLPPLIIPEEQLSHVIETRVESIRSQQETVAIGQLYDHPCGHLKDIIGNCLIDR